jgi:hypothetical protein
LRMMAFQPPRHLLIGLAAAFSILLPAVAERPNPAPDTSTIAEQYLLSAANQERAAQGLPPLHRSASLARAAAQHARVMAAHQAISHQFPGEPELTNRGASAGVQFSAIAENVGEAPSVVRIHDMWMHSEHHRENLLDPSSDSVGISVVNRAGELYAVEDFAKTVRAVSLDEQESTIAARIADRGRIALARDPEAVSAARETCTMSSGYAGGRRPWFVMRFTSDSLSQIPQELKIRVASGRYHEAAVGACAAPRRGAFTSYNFAVLLYP